MSCNDVDTSSTTSVVTSSSSSQITSVRSDTSLVETSSETDGEDFFDESSSSNPEESSSIEEQSSSEDETTSSVEQSSSVEDSSNIEESSSEESQESSIQVTYHVRFVNYDDSLLYEVDVPEGGSAVYVGDTPTKPDYEIYTYTFTGWDKDLIVINSDLTAKALYDQEVREEEQGWGPIHWFN